MRFNCDKYLGKVFTSNKCGDFTVIDYQNSDNVTVKFLKTGYVTTIQAYHIKDGAIKDRMHPSVYGVGVLGEAQASDNGKKLPEYRVWRGLLARCYNSKTKLKTPSYDGCTVSDNFKHYSYFKDWCSSQIGFGEVGWELDKDILVRGNKVYSENTCVFVPKEVNLLLLTAKGIRGTHPIGVAFHKRSGSYRATISEYDKQVHLGSYASSEDAFNAYKVAKEAYVKEVANKWKDKVDVRVYEALMNYQVEITD